jgi:hypothetical protein
VSAAPAFAHFPDEFCGMSIEVLARNHKIMSLVLAVEPDASQAALVTSLVRTKLGAHLQLVDSPHAAIVAMTQNIPDVVLLAHNLPQEQRTEIVTHVRSVTAGATQIRTIDIPQMPAGEETLARKIGIALAAAEYVRVHAMATMVDEPLDQEWNAVSMDAPRDDSIRAADVGLIEAEVEFRLKSELERLQADAAMQQARELARVEAEAADRRAREIARVEAEAAEQRAQELAKIEQRAAAERESAVAEARAAAEAAARESLAAELERVRREGEQQLAAEVSRIRKEAEHTLSARRDTERLQAEAAEQQARELARVEAEAAERRAREVARVEAEAAAQRAADLERIEKESASQRESALAEARAAAERTTREALAAELERVRKEGEAQLAEEIRRIRKEADQTLTTKLDVAQADAERDREERIAKARAEAETAKAARAEAEAAKRAAIEEARKVVEEAAARAKIAEDEVERVRSEANDQLKAAVVKARAENEARLQAEVARAQRETEARLEAQLASVIGQAEQAQHAHREVTAEADKIRREAAESARAAAELALAAETTRIRAEANEQLESEIARLRAENLRAQAERIDGLPMFVSSEQPGFFDVSKAALLGVRWDFVATAAICSLVVVAGVLYLPRAVRTAAHTSSTIVGSAGKAAKQAVAAAPAMTRRAMNAAERAIPKSPAVNESAEPLPSEAEVDAAVAAIEGHAGKDKEKDSGLITGPGFVTVYSRLPMQVYADGKRIGTSDDGQLMLPSGTHRLEFANTRFRYRSEPALLKILPGHVHPYNVVLPTVEVHVTTTPGAEVWVEGQRVGIAPLAPIQVPIGTREFVVKDATGEMHQAVEVKYGDALELTLLPQNAANATPSQPRLAPLSR